MVNTQEESLPRELAGQSSHGCLLLHRFGPVSKEQLYHHALSSCAESRRNRHQVHGQFTTVRLGSNALRILFQEPKKYIGRRHSIPTRPVQRQEPFLVGCFEGLWILRYEQLHEIQAWVRRAAFMQRQHTCAVWLFDGCRPSLDQALEKKICCRRRSAS
jgi:hypothetical protein